MGRPRNFDEAEALQGIMQVFWRYGFSATSTKMLEEATGIGVRGMANVFGDKEAIFLKALEAYHQMAAGLIAQIFAPPSLDAAIMLFTSLKTETDTPEDMANCGCLMVNTVFELGRTSDKIRKKVEVYRQMWRETFLQAAKNDGVTKPEERAEFLITLLWGALSQIRLSGSTTAAAPMADVAVETIKSWKA